jgi:hypothetical protein
MLSPLSWKIVSPCRFWSWRVRALWLSLIRCGFTSFGKDADISLVLAHLGQSPSVSNGLRTHLSADLLVA